MSLLGNDAACSSSIVTRGAAYPVVETITVFTCV